jgi:hypothetical protein
MGIFSRFFGKKQTDDTATQLTVNDAIPEDERLGLQLLLSQSPQIDQAKFIQSLRAFSPQLRKARCEFDGSLSAEHVLFGLVGWGKHVVQVLGFDAPMPAQFVEACVAPAHYPQEVKDEARVHRSHIMLWYAGYDAEPLERYIALAAVASALAQFGGIIILNETAHTSLPAGIFNTDDVGDDRVELLRNFPLSMLFCGFVKYEVEGVTGVWMRTYGAEKFGIPNLAALANGHHEGSRYCDIFDNVMLYLRTSKAEMLPGHTMQIGEEEFLRCRKPEKDEYFLQDETPTLVFEIISADQINKPAR